MCWGVTASVAMVAAGSVATAVAHRRGEPPAIWATVAFFTLMEALQVAGYATLDRCGTPANQAVTVLSYLHIAIQPIAINAFAMAIAPTVPGARMRAWVLALSGLATALLLSRLVPLEALGTCQPGEALCGASWCTRTGTWHIAWDMPLNGVPAIFGVPGTFPSYLLAVFALPLVYGAWRFVLFHLAAGPLLAITLTEDPNEMPAIWCLFSIGILLIALSPAVRHRVMGARRPAEAVS